MPRPDTIQTTPEILKLIARIDPHRSPRLGKRLEREKIVLASLPELSRHIIEIARELGRITIGIAITLTNANREMRKQHFRALVEQRHLIQQGRGRGVWKEYGRLPPIECLLFQLNQVFMNLLVNAAQAIDSHGTITLRTCTHDEWIWIEVTDTGNGIPPENIKQIFDQFFTTRPVGKGTGLGLSVSYSIVEKHHGSIEVVSEVGKGSTFRVWLPIRQA